MDRELLSKVIQRIKTVEGIDAFLILPVAAFHFSVVSGCIGTDKFVTDTKPSGSCFKQGADIPLAVGKTVCKLKTVVGLDALNPYVLPIIPLD